MIRKVFFVPDNLAVLRISACGSVSAAPPAGSHAVLCGGAQLLTTGLLTHPEAGRPKAIDQ